MPSATCVQRAGSSPSEYASSASSTDLLRRGRGVRRRNCAGGLVLDALVDEHRRVAAVVEDHVRAAVGPGQRLIGAPPVILERLALPGEHRDALRVIDGPVRPDDDGGRGVVLGREDVARSPADLGPESDERLDQDGCLHSHVQRAGDPRARQRLALRKLGAGRHQARASRARRAGSPCVRTRRATGRQP